MTLRLLLLASLLAGCVLAFTLTTRIHPTEERVVAVDNPGFEDAHPRALAYVAPLDALRPTTTTATTTTAPPRRKAVLVDYSTVWDRLAECESGGDWHIDAFHDGGLQFAVQTWASYAPADFPDYAYQATREQQIFVAERVLAEQGWGAWPVCSRKLGLR